MDDPRIPKSSGLSVKHARIIRGPSQVAYDITNKCNFRCLHCYNRSGENRVVARELSDDEVLSFAEDLASCRPMHLCFCGGEPMLRFAVLCEAAKILSSNGTALAMVTNGLLVSREKARKLLDSGVGRIQVSVDGASAKSHEYLRQRPGSFRSAFKAIANLREAGFKNVGIAYTPTSFNVDEIRCAVDICRAAGTNDFRVQPLMLLGRTQENGELQPNPVQYRRLVRQIYAVKRQGGDYLEWGDPIDHLIRFRTSNSQLVTFIGIRADGDIEISPYLPLVVGNVRHHRFSEYWESGLPRIWNLPIVRDLASNVVSVADMGTERAGQPVVWRDEEIEIDLIDNAIKV